MLSGGMLPRELPRCFSTTAFANASAGVADPSEKTWRTPTTLNLARPGSLRRRLGLPNPFAHRFLARRIAEGWTDLERHFDTASLSLTRPVPDPNKRRGAIWLHPWHARPQERGRRMNRGRYLLKSDVAEFYSSIYTHSLEWSLDGKAAAKSRLRARGPGTLGSELDAIVRNAQDGQTKGIPVGPDTSLILSEIVLTAVDRKLEAAMPDLPNRAFRAVDDLEAFLSTQSEAEDLLAVWQTALAEFELAPNIRKTEIREGPGELEPPWSRELRQMPVRTHRDDVCARDLYSVFSRAFELAREWRYAAVLSYAVRRSVAAIGIGPKSSRALQELVMAAAVIDPSSMRYGSGVIERLHRGGADVDTERYEATLNDVCEYHAKREHGSEVTWSLYEVRRLGLCLEAEAAATVAGMGDNCSLILLRDLEEQGQIRETPDFTEAIDRAAAPGAQETDDWLLALEYVRRGWASDRYLKQEDGWADLLGADIGFYETPPLLKVARRRSSAALAPDVDRDEREEPRGLTDHQESDAPEDTVAQGETESSETQDDQGEPEVDVSEDGQGEPDSKGDVGQATDEAGEDDDDDEDAEWLPPIEPDDGDY